LRRVPGHLNFVGVAKGNNPSEENDFHGGQKEKDMPS